MEQGVVKPSAIALQALIFLFSLCLIWFTFVYYPKVIKEKSFALPFSPFKDKVVTGVDSFPIQTDSYTITYEKNSDLYYVFVEGQTPDVYVENKDAAQLALKNALAVESLCSKKIIFSSVGKLDLPQNLKTSTNCN